jgi:hypothetical protein
VPTDLTAVLRCALAKDPARRYPDAAAFRDNLAQLSGNAGPVSVSGPVHAPLRAETTGPRPARPARRAMLLAGAALAAILVLLLGVWYFAIRDGVGATASPGAGTGVEQSGTDLEKTFGIRTIVEGCPAAGIEGGQARCAERAECWSGPVLINGEVNSIRKLPCDQEHSWETFAIAPVPPDVASPYFDVLVAHERVARVCSLKTLVASRFGVVLDIPASQWEADVLPPTPDDRAAQRSVYRCLGKVSGKTASGTAFRPRQ